MSGSIQPRLELGDVVRRFEPAFIQINGDRLMPSQWKALHDIATCHTAAQGGHRYSCEVCGKDFWVYHGCGNRSCPSCHTGAMRAWIGKREGQMLDCRYFHTVVTVPETIRAAFLAHQKLLYGLLMKTVASCILDLARDPKFLGATPAILAVLHTWRSDLNCHPHVHLLVSGGGVSEDGQQWIEPRHRKWLLPIRALSKLVRRRFRACLQKSAPEVFAQIDPTVWKAGWNSFCKPCGQGANAVLNYLGRYVYRVAITNHRIVAMDDTHVTFRYKQSKEKRWKTLRLTGVEFLRRFVMHVLPRGFHKVRYYGLWHHSQRSTRNRIRFMLASKVDLFSIIQLLNHPPLTEDGQHEISSDPSPLESLSYLPACPYCHSRKIRCIEILPHNRSP